MGRALDEHVVHVEKLVFLPFKIDACMWAAVDIGAEVAVLVDNEQGYRLAPLFEFEGFCPGVGNFVSLTQRCMYKRNSTADV